MWNCEAHLIDNPLHQVELSLQRGVEEKRQGVEFDPHAVTDALRSKLPQVCPLALRKADAPLTQMMYSYLTHQDQLLSFVVSRTMLKRPPPPPPPRAREHLHLQRE